MTFEWDARKAAANFTKHAIAFEDAATVFLDPLATTELNDLRPEYDLSQLKGGVRGKYYRRAAAGTNLVLIEPDLAILFPNAEAVNRALRVLAEAAKSTTAPKRRRAR